MPFGSVNDKRSAAEVLPDTIANVNFKGDVVWSVPALFKSSCRLVVDKYPFDVQQCGLKFGSWSHQGSELQLVTDQFLATRVLYDSNPNVEWKLLGVPVKSYKMRFPCCKDLFDYITYFVTMQRRPLYYLYHLAFPIGLLMVMGMFAFAMPPESGAKVSLAITTVLSMIVFIQVLMGSIPPTSEMISLFAIYIGGVTVMLSLTTYVSVIVLHVHYKGVDGRRPPAWLKKILFYYVAVPLCMADTNCCEEFCGCRAKLWGQTSADYHADHAFIDEGSRPTSPVPAMMRMDDDDDDQDTMSDNESLLQSAAKKLYKLVPNQGNSNNSGTDKRHSTYDKDRPSPPSPSQTRHSSLFPPSHDGSDNLRIRSPEPLSLADQVSVDIIDVLGDIIEELRLVHTLRSDTQIESDTKEFVQDEWHKVAGIINQGCGALYAASCCALCVWIWFNIGKPPELSEIPLPDDIQFL